MKLKPISKWLLNSRVQREAFECFNDWLEREGWDVRIDIFEWSYRGQDFDNVYPAPMPKELAVSIWCGVMIECFTREMQPQGRA